MSNNKNLAFSLIEILVVLAIISLAVGTIITVVKPTSTFQKSRDAKRETELRTIERFISSMLANDPTFDELNYVSTNTLYLSLQDSSSTCGSYLSQLPSLPSGWSYHCSATPTDITGQGWIPIPFSSNPLINTPQLPTDPLNKIPYYYTFTANNQGYELTAKKENKDEEIIVSNSTSRLTPISRGGTWMKTFGGNNNDEAYSISQTSDGGYIVAGITASYGAGGYDILIIKLDSSGNIQWSKIYGTSGNDYAYFVLQTSDGGYVVTGHVYYNARSYDVLVLKLDSSGNTQWAKTYGGTYYDYAYFISKTSDNGYIIGGYTDSYGAGGYDILILKVDLSGNLQWAKVYGGSDYDAVRSIFQVSDGGYIATGYTRSYGAGYFDFLVLKLDSSGNIQWAKTYGGTNNDYARSISQTSDGNYVVAGHTDSYGAGGSDFLVLKLDSSGNIQWAKTYGGSDYDYAQFISQTSDGNYIVTGYTGDYFLDFSDILTFKLDSSGNIQWAKKINIMTNDYAYSLTKSEFNNIVIAGKTESYPSPPDFLILKLDSLGNIDNCSYIQSITSSSTSPTLSSSSPGLASSTPSLTSASPSLSSSSPSLSSQKLCPAQ